MVPLFWGTIEKLMSRSGKVLIVVLLSLGTCFAQAPTFNKEVVRIFQANCQSCHHPGDIGPFSLMDYKSARPWAASIRERVALGTMPPWKPSQGAETFRGARLLSKADRDTIIAWVDGGSQEGNAADLPAQQTFPDGWTLGQPDLVLTMDSAFPVPASGNDIYRCFTMPTNFASDTYVSAIQIRPGNRAVVHHAILYSDSAGASKKLDDAEPGPGYTCFGGPGFNPDASFFAGWAPGLRPSYLSPGTAMQVPKGSRIAMQLHYHLNGQSTSDQTQIGIYFTQGPVDKLVYVLPMINQTFKIPAGNSHYPVQYSIGTSVFGNVHATFIAPHMHLLGREAHAQLTSSGVTSPLIDINDWDFQWQGIYDYNQPVAIPAGSTVAYTMYYDNSSNNLRNPNFPPIDVGWGEQTTDEMAVLFAGFTLDSEHRILPTFGADNVVNSASFSKGAVAPGSIMSLFGVGLGSDWGYAASLPLPRLLGRIKVNIGGVDAPLFYSSPSQVNFQIPYEASGVPKLTLTREDGKSTAVSLAVAEAQPGIFTFTSDGVGPAVATHISGAAVGSGSPASRGEILVLYTTGLGRVSPAVNTGEGAKGISSTVNAVTVNIGGRNVQPDFAGMSSLAGLYQVNFRIPADLTPGPEVPLKLTVAGVDSNTTKLAVQ